MSTRAELRDAAECSAGYMGVYVLAGLILIPVVSGITGPSEVGDLTGIFVIAHFISAAVLWLPGALTSLALDAWIGPAPWRRLWISGIVAVPVVWVGSLVAASFSEVLFEAMRPVVGWLAEPLIFAGWAILFSNLTLLVTWLLPPWKRPS